MRLLLDTCTFIWLITDAPDLSDAARIAITDSGNEVFLSAISAWEISTKHSLGKISFAEEPARLVPEMVEKHLILELPLSIAACFLQTNLPALHRDPFDRMLICQAIAHGLAIVTPDPHIRRYPVSTFW